MAFCDATGAFDLAALGAKGDGTGEGLKAMLAGNGEGAAAPGPPSGAAASISARRAVPRLFGASSPAGSTASSPHSRDGVLIVAVPGSDMSPEAQDTATEH